MDTPHQRFAPQTFAGHRRLPRLPTGRKCLRYSTNQYRSTRSVPDKIRKALQRSGVFTLNDICAAQLKSAKRTLASCADAIGGCVSNSGNANACTGAVGLADAKTMAQAAQSATGSPAPFQPLLHRPYWSPSATRADAHRNQAAAQRLESTAEAL